MEGHYSASVKRPAYPLLELVDLATEELYPEFMGCRFPILQYIKKLLSE